MTRSATARRPSVLMRRARRRSSPSAGSLGPCGPAGAAGPRSRPPSGDAPPDVEPRARAARPGRRRRPHRPARPVRAPARPTPPPPPPAATATAGTTIVRAYFFLGSFIDNAGLVPVLREVPETKAVGAAAMRALLAGPKRRELGGPPAMYTAIPEGTRFLGLEIEDGIATVNLSREFESGGGSDSMLGRLAQVVYTLTQFPTVTGVRFELDGVPVTVFSGEGVVLDAPVGRADYRDQLPAIFVDRPAWGASGRQPGPDQRRSPTCSRRRSRSVARRPRAHAPRQTVMASCGTGCWGTFEGLPYKVGRASGARSRCTSRRRRTARPRT